MPVGAGDPLGGGVAPPGNELPPVGVGAPVPAGGGGTGAVGDMLFFTCQITKPIAATITIIRITASSVWLACPLEDLFV